jgi:DNA modification methylase
VVLTAGEGLGSKPKKRVETEQLQVVYLPLADLLPYARNSRTHSDEQISQIASSVREFGFTNPILVSPENDIIAGHGRALAAAKLGMAEVPCIRLGHLTETQRKAYVIADNRLALNAGWDAGMLKLELLDLKTADFELDLLGFESKELDKLLAPAVEGNEGLTDPDAVPENAETRCKPGDLWILGKHRLLCGDSTNVQHVERLFKGEKPLLMVTDPPYGVKYDAEWRDTAGANRKGAARKGKVIADDQADWTPVWVLWAPQIAYVWHASQFTDVVMTSLRTADLEPRQQIIWNKSMHSLSRSAYHWKHEPCWYAVRRGSDGHWTGDRSQYTVWDAAPPNHIMGGSKDDKTAHPTQKPISLCERPVLNHTSGTDLVCDPFLGSGSTLIACEKTGRRCFGMEIDTHYCDVILTRWEKFSGQQAKLEAQADG